MKNSQTLDTSSEQSFKNRLSIAVFSALLSFAGFSYYYLWKSAAKNSIYDRNVVFPLLLTFFILFFPSVIRYLFQLKGRAVPFSDAGATISSVLLLVFASFLPSMLPLYVFSVSGGVFFVVGSLIWVRQNKLKSILFFLVFICIFSFWLITAIWGVNYATPFNLERLIANNYMHIDMIFHPALSQMVNTYGSVSIGLDGLVPLSYHYGSHWIIGHMAQLCHMNVYLFYEICLPIVLVPILYQSLLSLICSVRSRFFGQASFNLMTSGAWIFFVLLANRAGILFHTVEDAVGLNWFSDLVSESYVVGLTLSFLFLDFIYSSASKIINSRQKNRWQEAVVFLLVFPVSFWALGLVKISLSALILGSCYYFILRFALFKRPLILLSAALSFVGFLLAYRVTWSVESTSQIFLLHYIRSYIKRDYWIYFYPIYLVWVWTFIGIRLYQAKVRTFQDLKSAIIQRKLLDVEFLVGISLLGILPGMFLAIPSGSAYYFSDFQKWMSAVLLAGCIGWGAKNNGSFLKTFAQKPFVPCLLAFVTLATILTNYFYLSITRFTYTKKVYEEVMTKLPSAAPATKELVKILIDLGNLPLEKKREMMLYIPYSNKIYWDVLGVDPKPYYLSIIAPALTGVQMIRGNLVGGEVDLRSPYTKESKPLLDTPVETFCKTVKSANAKYLVILKDEGGMPKIQEVGC